MNGDQPLPSKARHFIDNILQEEGSLTISAISLWEISMLYTRNRILLNQPCLSWIQHSLQAPGISLSELTPEIIVDSCSLPNTFHGDPADRLIIATSRILNIPLMTRNKQILAYGRKGFVHCIEA